MCMNAVARVSFCTLLCCAWACGGGDSTGPVNQQVPADPSIQFFWTHSRITTPGKIWFGVTAKRPVARVELYHGSTKVAEIAPAADTTVIAASVTAADNGTQAYIVKAYDASGAVTQSELISVFVDIKWTLIQNVEGVCHGGGLGTVTDGNSIYYTGSTSGASYDMLLVKCDLEGHEQWTRTFGGPDNEFTRSIAIDGSGRVYVAGTVSGPAPTGLTTDRAQCFLNVYDAGGNRLATRQIKPASMDRTSSCIAAADASNNLYVIGYGSDATRAWTFALKYDGDGNLLWNREFGATPVPGSQLSNTELTGLAIDALGSGIYIGGHTGGTFDGAPNRGPQDLFIVKVDGDGKIAWASQYGTAGFSTFPTLLTADPSGGVYVAGLTWAPNDEVNSENALIASYAADGTRRWVRTIDGGWPDRGAQITVSSRGVYLVGWTYGARGGGREISEIGQVTFKPGSAVYEAFMDIFVARFSVDGSLQAVRMLGTPGSDAPIGIVTAANGDIYVAGNFGATPLLARLQDAP
jgi:hypothetical protein